MRSAPASACCLWRNGSRRVQTRPPIRGRASITEIAAPLRPSSRATVSPARPAPAMRTETPRNDDTVQPLLFLVEVLGKDQLQRNAVGRIGEAEPDTCFDVEHAAAVVDNSIDLMSLVASGREVPD